MSNKIFFTLLLAIALCFGSIASATLIPYTSITPTTSLVHLSSWTLDKIADGVTNDYVFPDGGFVSTSTSGTVHLTFNQNFNLTSFVLWNDVNIGDQGVRTFRLDFFNEVGMLLSSTSTLNAISILDQQIYAFSAVQNVKKVDFVILTSAYQIEIREVSFNGVASVPEFSSLVLMALGILTLMFGNNKK